MRFTERAIRDQPAPERGRRLIFDDSRDAPRGFGLAIRPTGARSFVLRYQIGGRDRLITIGRWPTWSVAAARSRANTLKRGVDDDDKPVDPLEQRAERRSAITVRDAVEQYCRRHADSLASGHDIRRTLERFLVAELGRRKLATIRKGDITDLCERVAKEGGHGRTAALILQYTKQVFAWAEDREHVDANPVATLKASRIAAEMKPTSRDRFLSHAEIRTLWARTQPPRGMRADTLAVLHLILATGQRPGEVARMRWRDIDDERKEWTVPAEHRRKTEEPHVVPLTEAAQRIIEAARQRARADAVYVFERSRAQPIHPNTVARAVRETRASLGNDDESPWRPHDLRRTARTEMAAAGVSNEVAERVIGHAKQGMTRVYNRHGYMKEKREALEAWEARLATIASGADPDSDRADVVEIDQRRHEVSA